MDNAALLGIDTCNEIFHLNYELAFLRFLINAVVVSEPKFKDLINDDTFANARIFAEAQVKARFPNVNLQIKQPGVQVEELQSAQASL